MQLKDKLILITGAGRCTGKLLADAFSQQGASLALVAAQELNPFGIQVFRQNDLRMWFK